MSQRKARVQRSARSTRECIVTISFQDKEVLTITVGLRWNIRVRVQKRLACASCTVAYCKGNCDPGGMRSGMLGDEAERNAVLAGDPKCLVYYARSKLNKKRT